MDEKLHRTRIALLLMAGIAWTIASPVRGEGGWRDEFDAICGKTEVAMTLSVPPQSLYQHHTQDSPSKEAG